MAVTTVQPRLIKYNDKDYDFNTLQLTVLNNYDKYARLFGYGRSKYEKDRLGLVEILLQMDKDREVTVNPYQIEFSGKWNTEKGAFGKPRNKSRHYQNPAWMIINTLQGMDAYDPNADKKKLSKDLILLELVSSFSGIDLMKNLENRKNAAVEAIDNILNKYRNPSDNYIIDENFDLNGYIDLINKLRNAILSPETNDDEIAFWRVNGLSNPLNIQETQVEENEYDKLEKNLRSKFGTRLSDTEITRIVNAQIKKDLEDIYSSLGINLKEKTKVESKPEQKTDSTGTKQKVELKADSAGTETESKKTNTEKSGTETKQTTGTETDQTNNLTTPENPPKETIQYDSKGRVNITGKKGNYKKGAYQKTKDGKLMFVNTNFWTAKGVPEYKDGDKILSLKKLKMYKNPDGEIKSPDGEGEPEAVDHTKVRDLIGAVLLISPMLGTWGKAINLLAGLGGAGLEVYEGSQKQDGAELEDYLRGSEYLVNSGFGLIRGGRRLLMDPKKEKKVNELKNKIKEKFNAEKKGNSEWAIKRQEKLNKELKEIKKNNGYDENKEFKELSDEEYNKLSSEEQLKYDNVKNANDKLNNFNTAYDEELNYEANKARANKDYIAALKDARLTKREIYGWNVLAPLAINSGLEWASLPNDLPYDFSFANISRVAAPLGWLSYGRVGPALKNLKNWYNKDGLTEAEDLFGESLEAEAASESPGMFRRMWEGRPKWLRRAKNAAESSEEVGSGGGIALGLTAPFLLATNSNAATSSRNMNTAYDLIGINGTQYMDPITGKKGILRGATVDENNNLDIINYYGFPVIPSLPEVTATGKMDDRLRELRMYIDPKTGISMIPGVNMLKVYNDPELRNLVDKSGAEFDMLGRYIGEIKPARTDLAYNNPLARAGRRILADLHGTSGTPSPLTVYPAAALAALGLTAAPWAAIGKGLGILGTASVANDAIDMLKTNPEVYRWLKNDWNLGNMYVPFNEYSK